MKLDELFDNLLDEARFVNIEGAWGMELVRDVDRNGFPALMAPSTFLRLALPLDRLERVVDSLEPSEEWVIEKIKDPVVRQIVSRSPKRVRTIAKHMMMGDQGQQGAIATPFLEVECPREWTRILGGGEEFSDPGRENFTQTQKPYARVKSHDGRHRMLAVSALEGDRPVPVHIYIRFDGETPDGDILRVADLSGYELAALYHNIRLHLLTERENKLVAGPLFELDAAALPKRSASGERVFPKEIVDQIIDMFTQGFQPPAIAYKLKMSTKDVNKTLRQQPNFSDLQRKSQIEMIKKMRGGQ